MGVIAWGVAILLLGCAFSLFAVGFQILSGHCG